MKFVRSVLMVSAAASALVTAAYAQDASAQSTNTQASTGTEMLETVIVTGQRLNQTLLRAATAVSSINSEKIEQFAPLAATDMLHNVPGIHVESSGGESNANLSFRGLPISAGGAKYAHFDEDGLPVLEFGDIAFGNADGFVKADYTIDRVEAVRGGTAATSESNAPGGVINFISKTGEVAGGAVGITKGLDYDTTRIDFDYGGPLGKGSRFNIGGYYHVGEGPLHAGFTAENGGQIKANFTQEFERGFVRLELKFLDDRTPTYLPTPFAISGSGSNPTYSALPGFNPLHGSFLSPYMSTNTGIGADGNHFVHNVSDGYHAVVHQVGGEFAFDVTKNIHLDDKIKFSQISGDFVSPYTAGVNSAASVASSTTVNGLTGSYFTYANGPHAGAAYSGLVASVVMFDSQIKSFDNFSNKLELTSTLDMDNGGSFILTTGYYKSRQIIRMDWDWDSYFAEVNGRNAALLDLYTSGGTAITSKGLYAYGSEFWGQCCQRLYNLAYDTDAPYASLNYEIGGLDITGALRYDMGKADGTYGGGNPAVVDVDGNGVITRPEMRVPVITAADLSPVNYNTHYLSWAIDVNYAFSNHLAVFASASRGGRTNADRLTFGNYLNADGSLIGGQRAALNMVTQFEGGLKWAGDNFLVLLTPYYSATQETNYDVTQPANPWKDLVYHAYGVELEGSYNIGNLSLSGGATYTHARIVKDMIGTNKGHHPQRMADWMYQMTAVYNWNPVSLGLNLNGQTDSYTGDDNSLVQPGYALVNGFVQYNFDSGLSLQLNAHNLFDSLAITEVDSGATAYPGYITARTQAGRTVSLTLKYEF